MIFYIFLQESAKRLLLFKNLLLHAGPWKELRPCNWVLGRRQRRGSPEFGQGWLTESAGEGRGSAQELTYDRFEGWDVSKGVSTREVGSARRWWPLQPIFRRTGRLARDTRDLESSRGAVGRPQKVVWVIVQSGRESSSWRRQWRVVVGTADGVGSGQGSGARGGKGLL
jgi:hypothetical protein